MQQNRKPRAARAALRAQAGMTLLEIMIVLAIIALVMGFLLGPRIFRALGESKVKTAHIIAKKFANEGYPQWAANNPTKSCPDNLQALSKYVDNDGKDPWGQDYIMLCGDTAQEGIPGGFGVMSNGEDKKPGTPDDIKSWQDPPTD
jgi:prepilin-type N-terminal cleavage/methylation domain-containing protein